MEETRHKAIVILVTPDHKLLTVKDSRHQEWIFVTGGCKRSEIDNPLKCGLRELEEETRGVVNLRSAYYTEFSFVSKHRTPEELKKDLQENVVVTLVYHVYILRVPFMPAEQVRIRNAFLSSKALMEFNKLRGNKVRKAYDENDDLSFDTLEEFNRKRQWKLITQNIVHNPLFYFAMNSPDLKFFNL